MLHNRGIITFTFNITFYYDITFTYYCLICLICFKVLQGCFKGA